MITFGDTVQARNDFYTQVAKGFVPGHSFIRKFAYSSVLPNGVLADIWDYPGVNLYTFSASDDINTISSGSALDVGNTIRIYGHDVNFNNVTQDAILNGQNKVTLSTPLVPLMRVHRMQNLGAQLNGDVYLYEDTAISGGIPSDATKVRAYIDKTINGTLMGNYTVANGYTAYALDIQSSIEAGSNVNTLFYSYGRPFGGSFIAQGKFTLNRPGQTVRDRTFVIPEPVPGKTDLKASALADTVNTYASGGFTLLLVDNNYL